MTWTASQIDRLDAFDSIIVDHPRRTELHRAIRNLMMETTLADRRYEKRLQNVGNRFIKREELYMLPIIGPSGATKTKSITSLVDEILSDPNLAPEEQPVVTVTVNSSLRSTRQLQAHIMAALGDGKSASEILKKRDYVEAVVNYALFKRGREVKLKLVILDEVHSMLRNLGPDGIRGLATSLKSFVNDGLFSLVLVGTDEARVLLAHSESHSRQKLPVDFGAFGLGQKDISYFVEFVTWLEKLMVQKGVMSRPLGLVQGAEMQAVTYEMAAGVIGTVSRILRLGLEYAFEQGQDELEMMHVAAAFRAWNSSLPKPGRDPFKKQGPSENIIRAMKAKEALEAMEAE